MQKYLYTFVIAFSLLALTVKAASVVNTPQFVDKLDFLNKTIHNIVEQRTKDIQPIVEKLNKCNFECGFSEIDELCKKTDTVDQTCSEIMIKACVSVYSSTEITLNDKPNLHYIDRNELNYLLQNIQNLHC